MAHVIVDMEFSLVTEQFEVQEVTVIKAGKRVSSEIALLHRLVREFIQSLISIGTADLKQQVEVAMNSGNPNTEFELRKQLCLEVIGL